MNKASDDLYGNMLKLGEKEVLVEFYPVSEPFGHIAIVMSRDTGRYEYRVLEPPLTPQDKENILRIRELLIETSRVKLEELRSFPPEEILRKEVKFIIKKFRIPVSRESFDKIYYYIKRDTLGYGKIDIPMKDRNVEDLSCDGVGFPIYIWHRKYESIPSNIVFDSEEELNSLLIKMSYKAGKQISVAQPIVEGSLPGGFRIHLTLSEISRRGGSFTIRKFREVPFSIIDLVNFGTLNSLAAAYFWYLIEEGKSTMIIGATASGKTTTLNAIATFIRPEAKIITIEDTPELNLLHENWVPLMTRPSYEEWVRNVDLYELLRSAMRMRPDYLIIGEIRGKEAFTLFQAIATGHSGMCTMHAENIDYAIKRLLAVPMEIPIFLLPVMNVYAHIKRIKVKGKIVRRIVSIQEAVDIDPEKNTLILEEVFKYNPITDQLEQVKESVLLKRIAEQKFKSYSEVMDEINRRKEIVDYLASRNITDFINISRVTRDYYYSPARVYRAIISGTYRV
ncbi:MAG: hypothetical protein DRJ64_01690 [Thermoprotei archaeon]|nr:MAG: hypothetical protein DRJ64_01690 [Thermoprotei archaeon]